MRSSTVLRRALGVALVTSAVAGHADAQSGDASATADQLFDEGRELAKVNRWAEACPKFEASLRTDPALGARLNLAMCYEHVGKLARAWRLYRESTDLAEQAGDVKRRDFARTHAAALEPRLARFAITAPVTPPAGFAVRWDGSPIEAGALGVSLYADAGRHEITASAPGFESFAKTVALVEGKTETLAIPDLAAAPVPAPELATPPAGTGLAPAEPAAAPPPTRTYVAIGLGAAGLATAGAGLLFGAKARSTFHDAKQLCGTSLACPVADYGRGKQLIRDARSDATLATVLVAAGGAAIVAGAVVFLTRPDARDQRAARIVPVAHEHGAGVAIAGRF